MNDFINDILDYHPSKKYPGMTVYDYLSGFWYTITFGALRFKLRTKWCLKYGKKIPVYSPIFQKDGYLLENGLFVPDDKSFSWGYDPDTIIKGR